MRTWGDLDGLGGRAEISPSRFRRDPLNFAQFEHAVDAAQIFPTPCPRPGFRPSFDPHKKTCGSRILRKCWGRADFGRRRDFFAPLNFAWVEQNMAPARFGSSLGPGQVWPGPMLARAQVRDPKISDAKVQSFFQKVSQGSPKGICMVWS